MPVTEVARGVLAIDTSVADGKVGIIAGVRVALVVDAGIDDAEGAAALAAAAALGRATTWLALTHGHADHALGATAFRDHEVIANAAIAQHMEVQLDEWAALTGTTAEVLRERLAWPTIMVGCGGDLDLGDRRVMLLDTPGHAPGAMCVWDPGSGVLFGGDTVVTAIPPVFRDGDSATLERTLRRLAELEVEVLVPGHGDVVHGRAAARETILWAADYVARCREHVRDRLGDNIEAAVRAAPFEAFIGDRLAPDRHRMTWRHEQSIRLAYEEARRALDAAPDTTEGNHAA